MFVFLADDSAIKVTSGASVVDESNTEMTNDDGDEPYDPFDGEDDDLESSVTPNHSLLPSKSSSLSSSPMRLLPEISSVKREVGCREVMAYNMFILLSSFNID